MIIIGYFDFNYWWVVSFAAVCAIGFADQTLTDNNPLAFNKFVPGPRYKDVVAGLFGFAGALAGFSTMYFIGKYLG